MIDISKVSYRPQDRLFRYRVSIDVYGEMRETSICQCRKRFESIVREGMERVTMAAFDSASCNITMDMPNMTEDEKIAFNKILDALRTAYRGVMV